MTKWHGLCTHAFLLLVLSIFLGLAGCEGDDGADGADGRDGTDGAAGADGTPGADGQACWDLNGNGIGDPDEDINGDGVVDVKDCNAFASGAYRTAQLHVGFFTENVYEGTESCLLCHGKLAEEVLETAHFKWEGVVANIEGLEGQIHGKRDILNNFCVAVPTNEGRCTQCHTGYGWKDGTFDFQDVANIDCLVCHDQTDTYEKDEKTAGAPRATVDLQLVARSVAMRGGRPSIDNCIDCHAKAGGGDNVKHGDISTALQNTTREFDVHMGTDGIAQYDCVNCHDVKRDGDENPLSHGIGGMPFHSVDEGNMRQCDDCHGSAATVHANAPANVQDMIASHSVLACQVCHIPAIARQMATKTEWWWEDAGPPMLDPIPVDDTVTPPKPLWDIKKGSFKWANNVRPELRYFNGKWTKMVVGTGQAVDTDTYDPDDLPVVLGAPVGSWDDGESKIYPFKKMIGNQVADVVNNRIMVPHLFGTAGGDNPYWGNWDWDKALLDASAVTGQPYESGNFGFVETEMYLTVNHEVAPKEMALGFGGGCGDCHFEEKIDWAALGYTIKDGGTSADPVIDGERL